jgi:hypothetical protein
MESPLLQYKNDRAAEYPSIEEQLDMIFHEIKTNGSITTFVSGDSAAEGWAYLIQSVKDKYPKPTELDVTEV